MLAKSQSGKMLDKKLQVTKHKLQDKSCKQWQNTTESNIVMQQCQNTSYRLKVANVSKNVKVAKGALKFKCGKKLVKTSQMLAKSVKILVTS